jgi:hypothetical protein
MHTVVRPLDTGRVSHRGRAAAETVGTAALFGRKRRPGLFGGIALLTALEVREEV